MELAKTEQRRMDALYKRAATLRILNTKTDGQYPVLKLTEKSKDVLYKKENVYLSAPVNIVIAKEPVIYQQHPYEKELFENLKNLRKN